MNPDPFSLGCPGFLNLLSSQSSQPIDLTGGCSQVSDEVSTKERTIERRKWSPKEDVVLISAWLNTSKDPIIGNEQKAGTFWKRIQEYYNASSLLAGAAPREVSHCKQRWSRLNDLVCKFVGSYEAAMKEQSSGQNENDLMKTALDIFYNDYGVKFTLEHAWRELRHDQKWTSTVLGKDGAKDKSKNDGDAEGSEAGTEERPLGVKAFKALKRKRTVKETEAETMKNIMELKKELNKQKLLDKLLTQKDPLSDIEVALKNKLIQEML